MIIDVLLNKIYEKNKIHSNNLSVFFNECDEEFKAVAESYLSSYCDFLIKNFDINMDFIVDSYLLMVKDIVIEQTKFKRSGKYSYSTINEADENVYSNKEYMFKYMIGVALSQFLWKNHKDMFEFFRINIIKYSSKDYLEIGCGHGLFFLESVKGAYFEKYRAVDISQTSLDITKKFTRSFFGTIPDNVEFTHKDITKADSDSFGKFDFITMGEVLEHVEVPHDLLYSIKKLLKENGHAYISTCANCPVKDHIFLYSSINDIRRQFNDSGLIIVDEVIISNDNILEAEWELKKSNLSYAAIVKLA